MYGNADAQGFKTRISSAAYKRDKAADKRKKEARLQRTESPTMPHYFQRTERKTTAIAGLTSGLTTAIPIKGANHTRMQAHKRERHGR